MNKFSDLNNLYKAYTLSKKASNWKPQVQMYEMDYLSQLVKTSSQLEDHSYTAKRGATFTVNERGKERVIRSNPFSDRVVRKCLCDQELTPVLKNI